MMDKRLLNLSGETRLPVTHMGILVLIQSNQTGKKFAKFLIEIPWGMNFQINNRGCNTSYYLFIQIFFKIKFDLENERYMLYSWTRSQI